MRASRISNNLPDLKREMNNIFLKLVKRGHPVSVLKRAFQKWLLDTYPEPKFQEFVDRLKKHFFYLIAEVKRIFDGVGDPESRSQALREEKPYIKYRDLLTANAGSVLPTPQPLTLSSLTTFTSDSSSSTSTTTSESSSSDGILDIDVIHNRCPSTTSSDNVLDREDVCNRSTSPTSSALRCSGCGATGPISGPNRGRPFKDRRALVCHQNKCTKYKLSQTTATGSDTTSETSTDSSGSP